VGDNRGELQDHLAVIEKYLAYASLFYESFGIRENRGVFWWSLHKLLESPSDSTAFKDLRLFLKSVPRNPYSRHMAATALIRMQQKSYVSLCNAGTESKPKLKEISDATQIKLEPAFFAALQIHSAKFLKTIAGKHKVGVSDLDLYIKVNQFYRGPYYAEWSKLVSQIGALGQQLGGTSALQIETKLNDYAPYWVTINFLWAQHLRALIGNGGSGLRFDDISHDLNRITFVTRSELRKTLQYLMNKTKILALTYVAGRPVYAIDAPFHNALSEFNRVVAEILEEFLSSLG
jgi:hypothetical protein